MSRSYHSQKEVVIARRRVARAEGGEPLLPRIIEREPAPGDIHPLPKRTLRHLLRWVPVEFLHGLSRIELRARQSEEFGLPFGSYWRNERAIVLYSLPPRFRCFYIGGDFRRSLEQFHAVIRWDQMAYTVTWPQPDIVPLWFYSYVFAHELGHHFVEQYKTKNGRIQSWQKEELVADLWSRRLTTALFSAWRRSQSTGTSAAIDVPLRG